MTADAQRPAMHNLALGIDVGTSGVRAAAVDETGLRVAFAAVKMTVPLDRGGLVTQDPAIWWEATRRVFQRLSRQIELKGIGAIAVTGTSGTILGVHANGRRLPRRRCIIAKRRRRFCAELRRSLLLKRSPAAPRRRWRVPLPCKKSPGNPGDSSGRLDLGSVFGAV